jgi:predicted dienelactone hydrolase
MIMLSTAAQAAGAQPPSVFGVDAPELAPLGKFAVGVRTLILLERDQPDVLAIDTVTGVVPKFDRTLRIDLWYPARAGGTTPEVYSASLPSEPPSPPVSFSVPGIAVRDAPRAGDRFPLVVVSHGYSNSPAAMSWLTENLASKGYVVAAIRHEDPPITDKAAFAQPVLRRPLDIVYVMRTLQKMLGAEHLIEPERTALIGYSMGGYGVLTAAGASLDAKSPLMKMVPGGLLLPYVKGGAMRDAVTLKGLRAVVAMAPAGGGTLAAWGTEGIRDLHVPLLLIAGDDDRTVNYATGARAIFDTAAETQRYLLTFKGCGHAIGLNPVPDSMRQRLWDEDWFEDPVWRKERIIEINAHFISAFLDRYVKGDESRAAYLTVAVTDSSTGAWPNPTSYAYDAFSPATEGVTVWKGFQKNHAAGLQLLQASAAPRSN